MLLTAYRNYISDLVCKCVNHFWSCCQNVDTEMSSTEKRDRSNSNSITLRIAELIQDVGRRIARVDPKGAQELGLSTCDAIEVSSAQRKKTTVLNWPAYQQDYGKGLIRIDGYTRNRLDVGINDTVDVRKVEAK